MEASGAANERVGFQLDRIRLGEWVFAVAALALVLDVLVLPWNGVTRTFRSVMANEGQATSFSAAQAHHLLGPFALVVAFVALATWALQGLQKAPAIPLCFTVVLFISSFVLSVGLFVAVVVEPPQHLDPAAGVGLFQTDVGAVIGVFLAIVVFGGTWLSLRQDGIAEGDAPAQIETLRLQQRPA